jgi:hypothetical protein
VRPNQPRETLDGAQTPRRASPAVEARSGGGAEPVASRERPSGGGGASADRVDRPDRSGERAQPASSGGVGKLNCTTNQGESFEITSEETFIGRSKQCAIVLKSQRVSRKHACVTKEADGFYINDLGAANGIWAGSEKIDREKIETGDEFIVGDVVLTFTLS